MMFDLTSATKAAEDDLGVIIVDGMNRYGNGGFKPGDVIITNHQAVAGQHLNNVVIYMPYIFQGELLMFSIVRAHWIDIGGMSTGFGAATSVVDPWQEGLQFDQIKLYEGGVADAKMLRMISDNIRFPESSMGDLRSQMAACTLAERRLEELYTRYGRETVQVAIPTMPTIDAAMTKYLTLKLPPRIPMTRGNAR